MKGDFKHFLSREVRRLVHLTLFIDFKSTVLSLSSNLLLFAVFCFCANAFVFSSTAMQLFTKTFASGMMSVDSFLPLPSRNACC